MIFTPVQKQILQKLLTKFESSKTYKGENTISQSFSIKPSDIMKDYDKDSADINLIEDFDKQCSMLESEGFIRLEKKYGRISKIIAGDSNGVWDKCRTILGVKDKKARLNEEISFYSQYLKSNSIIAKLCEEQIFRLQTGKEAKYEIGDAKNIIGLLSFIQNNKDEVLERELSVLVLHDSKLWEKKYKTRICKLLQQETNDSIANQCLDEKEYNKILLEQHNIYDNPTYVYFKGEGTIFYSDGNVIKIFKDNPIAVSSVSLKNIKEVEIKNAKIMTIENLTSFNRLHQNDFFYIYLSGYHNSAKQEFLKLVYKCNVSKEYFHFGDIDPDGFLILENLKNKTGIPFLSYKMSVLELKKYTTYTKILEQNDITKANGLISRGQYADEMSYLLQNNCKLEQEIISCLE